MNATAENIIPLTVEKAKLTTIKRASRFKIQEFTNRSGTQSWRVSGMKRDGARVRENFSDVEAAQCRQIELETEYLRGHTETMIQATKLSAEQVQLAEVAFMKLGDDWQRILDCVDHWKRTGAKNLPTDAPRIDEAVDQYLEWLKNSTFRHSTKQHWKTRMTVFKNSVPNIRVSESDPEFIERFLETRNTSPGGKDTDRRAVSRFFSWCIERPRRWAITNPCREVSVVHGEKSPPEVLSLEQCKKLLSASTAHKDGLLAPYVAICLFGGLRPFEASRLTWDAVNLKDGEIRLEASQTKTKTSRVISICPTMKSWLTAHKGKSFYPANWRKEFSAVKKSAGIKKWPHDVMRHTAISHYFRKTGSYGQAAEQFGNSEAIIKRHYQGRVTSDETKKFYALMPKNGGVK